MGDLKVHNISEYKSKYSLKTFVETGTLHGDAVQYAIASGFHTVHSIEIMEELAEKAKQRFANIPHVKIHNESSVYALKYLVPAIETNTLFWLDAHFPGADARLGSYVDAEAPDEIFIPLKAEIDLISSRKDKFKDVLIIDDLWLYEDGPFEAGNLDAHLQHCNHGTTKAELGRGSTSQFVYDAFAETHNITKDFRHQGYLILTPK